MRSEGTALGVHLTDTSVTHSAPNELLPGFLPWNNMISPMGRKPTLSPCHRHLFPLGLILPSQQFSCCISLSLPSFGTFIWNFPLPFAEKPSKPGLKSPRSLHTLAQTAWKSSNMNYQAQSARCHSEFFSGVTVCVCLCVKCLLFHPLPVTCLPSGPTHLFLSSPSFRRTINQCLDQKPPCLWLMAGGPSRCCYAHTHRLHLFEKWHACLKWLVASKAHTSSGLLLSWAILLFRRKRKERTVWAGYRLLGTHTWTWPACTIGHLSSQYGFGSLRITWKRFANFFPRCLKVT